MPCNERDLPDHLPRTHIFGPLLEDRLKENLKKKKKPLFSLSCLSIPELQSTHTYIFKQCLYRLRLNAPRSLMPGAVRCSSALCFCQEEICFQICVYNLNIKNPRNRNAYQDFGTSEQTYNLSSAYRGHYKINIFVIYPLGNQIFKSS